MNEMGADFGEFEVHMPDPSADLRVTGAWRAQYPKATPSLQDSVAPK